MSPDLTVGAAPASDEGWDDRAIVRVGRNSLILLASQSITWVLSTILVLVIPRYFGPEALGWFTVAASLWTIAAMVIGLGTSTYLTRDFASRQLDASDGIAPVIRVRLVTAGAAFVVLVAFAVAAGYRSEVITMVVIVGVSTVLSSLADVAGSALVGLERMKDVGRADVVSKLCSTACALVLLLVTRNLFVVVATGMLLAAVRGAIQFRRLAAVAPYRLRTGRSDMVAVVRASSPFLVAGLSIVIYQQVDTVVMSFLVDDRDIGWYSAADGLYGTLLFAPTILMTSLLPAFTREHTAGPAAARRLLEQAFDGVVLVAVPLGVSTIVCAWSGTRLLFGGRFDGAGPVLAVLGVVLAFSSLAIVLGSFATATGRQRVWNWLMLAAIIATVPLDLVLVPWTERRFGNGAIAGALSYVVTESTMVVVGIVVLAPRLITRARLHRIVRCLAAGGLQLAAAWPFRHQIVAIPGVVGLAVYCAAIVVLRIPTPTERRLVADAAERVISRISRRLRDR